jgi:hypothetical protein
MEQADSQFEKEKIAEVNNKFVQFLHELKGWMTSPDGEDFCPECWKQYLDKLTGAQRVMALDNSGSTAGKHTAKTRKAADGWLAFCEKCGKDVFVPYQE